MISDQNIPTYKQTYWHTHVKGWRKSSLSQKEYCRSRSIALATFCYWKRRLDSQKENSRFYLLTVTGKSAGPEHSDKISENLILHYRDLQLEICHGFSPSDLKTVISVLEQIR